MGRAERPGLGLHFKGMTTSGVPLLELTPPDVVRLQVGLTSTVPTRKNGRFLQKALCAPRVRHDNLLFGVIAIPRKRTIAWSEVTRATRRSYRRRLEAIASPQIGND
jgi:hypothetical protein